MNAGFLGWASATDFGLGALMTLISFGIVCVPFYRGLRICGRALAATRRVPRSQLSRAAASETGERTETLAVLMVRVLSKSLRESDEHPTEFVLDATKQFVMNEYDVHYARPISMYANLLPPIGFTGTTVGILMRLLSMHLSNQALELGALATALVATVLALISFASMEAVKVYLYNRLLRCLDEAISAVRLAEEEPRERRPATAAAG